MKKIIFLAIAATVLFSSCKKDEDNNKAGIFKGPETEVFDGKAWTWVQLNKQGIPERVAISINDDALNSVSSADGSSPDGHHHDTSIVLKFHPKANATLFKHAWLIWNPTGHPPVGVYTKPHFDLHYYMVPSEERETFIDPVKLNAAPAMEYLPANYIGTVSQPARGKHWIDRTSPELDPTKPQLFTQTFVYGSYDSRVLFYEPAITLEFLKNTASFERLIPQPVKFEKSGYYPTKMRVVKHDKVTEIILEDMVCRNPLRTRNYTEIIKEHHLY